MGVVKSELVQVFGLGIFGCFGKDLSLTYLLQNEIYKNSSLSDFTM